MKTTIREVARSLGLSITTVSRALDGYDDVAQDTREAVRRAARELGYIPDRAARQLRRRRTDTLGYVLPAGSGGFSDPFFTEFIAGLGDACAANNQDLLVTTAVPDSEAEKEAYRRWVQGGKVDGIVINRMRLNDWRVRYLVEQRTPHVALERAPEEPDFVGVEVDARHGMIELVDYLVFSGHSRIAYIGGNANLVIEQDRRKGLLDALAIKGIRLDAELCLTADLSAAGGYAAARRLLELERPPSAIVCINDLTAVGALHAVHELGLKAGRDVAVAGFDGLASSAYTQPPLTTLDQPVYDIARMLVRMLIGLLNGETGMERNAMIQPVLVLRQSTGR